MNKRIAALLAAIVIVPLIAAAVGTVIIMPQNVTAARNTTIQIPVLLDNEDPVAGLQFTMNYPDGLEYVELNLTERMSNATVEAEATNNTLMVAAIMSDNITAGSGAIMNIIFAVNESAQTGNYTLNLSDILISDISMNSLPVDAESAVLTVE